MTPIAVNLTPSHSLSRHTCNTNNSTRSSHSNHRIHIGYHDNLTDRPNTTTDTTHGHRPSSKSERNLIILQVNINGIKNKLEELKLLIHDIITIQETKLTPKTKTPKVHNFTTVRTDRLHKAGGGLITLIRGFRCRRCDGTIQVVDLAEDLMVDGETYECVKSFCYLGDTLEGDSGADLAATARIRNG